MKISVKITALLLLLVSSSLLIAGIHFLSEMHSALRQREVASLEQDLLIRRDILLEGILRSQEHVALLANNQLTVDFLSGNPSAPTAYSYLDSLFENLLAAYPDYFQARIISNQGMELLRVQRNSEGIHTVKAERLQDKSDRYYVRDTLSLAAGQFFFSPLDLNREHGQIQQPRIQTLRIATPVFNPGGQLLGMVVLNRNMAPLINRVLPRDPFSRLYITNSEGYFIYHPDQALTYGFEFDQPFTLASELPEITAALASGTNGMAARTAKLNGHFAFAADLEYGSDVRRRLQIIKSVPKSVINERVYQSGQRYLISVVVLIILGSIAAILLSRFVSSRLLLIKRYAASVSEGARQIDRPSPHKDEIDEIAASFSTMLETIAASEETIRRGEQRIRAILDTVLNGVITIDNRGKIIDINRAGADIFQYQSPDLVGTNVRQLMPAEDAQHHDAYIKNYVHDGKPHIISQQRELFGLRRDGAQFPIQLAVSELNFEGEHLFVGAIVDISERRAFETSLRTMNQELTKKNRDLENFAYIASHDLQEPIRKIISFANILKDTEAGNLSEDGMEILQRSEAAALRMQELVKSVLALARIKKTDEDSETIDLNLLIRETMEHSLPDTHYSLQCAVLPKVRGIRIYLHQLFYNLINNAIKFCPPEREPAVEIRAGKGSSGMVEILVMDNGIGIDEEHRDKIFAPFVRLNTRESFPGTGIGLAICRRVAELHGGKIAIMPNPGEGSTFIVSLPLVNNDEQ